LLSIEARISNSLPTICYIARLLNQYLFLPFFGPPDVFAFHRKPNGASVFLFSLSCPGAFSLLLLSYPHWPVETTPAGNATPFFPLPLSTNFSNAQTTTKLVIEAQNSNKNFRQVHDKKGKGATCTDSGIIMHANQY